MQLVAIGPKDQRAPQAFHAPAACSLSLVPDVLELSAESEATKKLYGIDSQDENKRRYGIECLRARRLVEAGVRFVEVLCPNVY